MPNYGRRSEAGCGPSAIVAGLAGSFLPLLFPHFVFVYVEVIAWGHRTE